MNATSFRHMLTSYDRTAPSRRSVARPDGPARGPGDMVHVINVRPYPSAGTGVEQRARQAGLDRERFQHVPGSITDEIVRRANCDVDVVYAHREAGTPGPGP